MVTDFSLLHQQIWMGFSSHNEKTKAMDDDM